MPITGMNVSIYGNGNNACLQHHVPCMCAEFTRELNRMSGRSEFVSRWVWMMEKVARGAS